MKGWEMENMQSKAKRAKIIDKDLDVPWSLGTLPYLVTALIALWLMPTSHPLRPTITPSLVIRNHIAKRVRITFII